MSDNRHNHRVDIYHSSRRTGTSGDPSGQNHGRSRTLVSTPAGSSSYDHVGSSVSGRASTSRTATQTPARAQSGDLVPARTGTLIPARTGTLIPARTGTLVPARTGTLIPARTGTLIPAQSARSGTSPSVRSGTSTSARSGTSPSVRSGTSTSTRAQMIPGSSGSQASSPYASSRRPGTLEPIREESLTHDRSEVSGHRRMRVMYYEYEECVTRTRR